MSRMAEASARPERQRAAALFDAIAGRRLWTLAAFALVALLTRSAMADDWNYEIDVQFYMLAARRMLDGALLYVDVWDRKPPLLFLFYAPLVALPWPVVAVQIAGGACTAAAAYGIQRIARGFTGAQGSLLAGAAYCVLTLEFGGATAQAPVLFAPLMVAACWSIAASLPQLATGAVPLRVWGGIASAGLAIACKQSAVIEGAAFGVIVVVLLWRGGARGWRLLGPSLGLAATGAAPMLAAGLWYYAIGHFADLWQALVLSNTARYYPDLPTLLGRYAIIARALAPIALFAVMGCRALWPLSSASPVYRLAIAWLGAAIVSLLAYPGLYLHYALPLLLPLCLLAAPLFQRRDIGLTAAAALMAATLWHSGALDFGARARSREASAQVTQYLRAEAPGRRILAWNGSPWLYELVGAVPPTRLLFPAHLYDGGERNASGLDPTAEVRRILAWRPEAVIVKDLSQVFPPNDTTMALVSDYVKGCRRVRPVTLYDLDGPAKEKIYSGCAEGRPAQSI